MDLIEKLNVGVVGAVGRGASFRAALEANGMTRIHAVCDINEEALQGVKEKLGAVESYTEYDEMLEKSEIDAVIIGTPMQFHAPMAIKALRRGLHVMSEVTAGVSVQECRELVEVWKQSNAVT